MEEIPKKLYIAYKISQNIACMELKKERVLLWVKLDPKRVDLPRRIARDVTTIGHYGTGDLELSVSPSLTRLPNTRLLSTGYKGRNAQVALQTR